jgi:protein-L-isoaspartate(D-aspartate) O-methyltransferase
MDRQALAFESARNFMVDSQVRPNKVNDPRIIGAMRRLPRERFVPPQRQALAYADTPVPLGNGRALLEPMVIARLVQLAAVRDGDRVLVVGAGSGYGAALLAACGGTVTALEEDPALISLAPAALSGVTGITLVTGPLAEGWQANAPYDAILVEGAAEEFPPALVAQLRPATAGRAAGRLVAVRAGGAGTVGQAVLGEATPAGLVLRPAFDCAAPVLAALRRQPGFVF